MSKIVTKATLNGKVVELVDSFGSLNFYRYDREDESIVELFLVSKDGDVLRKITVEADSAQNFGCISEVKFTDE